ncbi:MAG: hypothetical protein HOA17_06885 [Candidatus Melainabacteria bacterium]|jgi:hypothetical protein|nr:hypothetical protein [Candidatus Melainabacteria bacterium]
MSKLGEIRNGLNNAARRVGLDAVKELDGVLSPPNVYIARKAIKVLTTPIHIGRKASDSSDWDQPAFVIGSDTAKVGDDGVAVALKETQGGRDSIAISLAGKAQTESGGSAVSVTGAGAQSGEQFGEVYVTDFYTKKEAAACICDSRQLLGNTTLALAA